MKTYTAIQGETWDQIAIKVYGRETAMDYLIGANWEYRYMLFFKGGEVLKCPDIPPVKEYDPPKWKER